MKYSVAISKVEEAFLAHKIGITCVEGATIYKSLENSDMGGIIYPPGTYCIVNVRVVVPVAD